VTNKKKIIILGSLVFLVLIVLVLLFVGKAGKKKTVIVAPVVNETTESTSAFEELGGTEPLEENKENAKFDPMNFAMKFLGRYDVFTSGVNKTALVDVLVPSEVLAEVNITSGVRSYKIIASKNESYYIGDTLKFEPIVNPETLVVAKTSEEIQTIYFSRELPDFVFPGSLNDGDRIAFFCEVDNCSDKKFAWALVF
jgi:hypothetical protein